MFELLVLIAERAGKIGSKYVLLQFIFRFLYQDSVVSSYDINTSPKTTQWVFTLYVFILCILHTHSTIATFSVGSIDALYAAMVWYQGTNF